MTNRRGFVTKATREDALEWMRIDAWLRGVRELDRWFRVESRVTSGARHTVRTCCERCVFGTGDHAEWCAG